MTSTAEKNHLEQNGLYCASNEHDACGVGFVAHIRGEKSHAIVTQALKILENLDHRGAGGADRQTAHNDTSPAGKGSAQRGQAGRFVCAAAWQAGHRSMP